MSKSSESDETTPGSKRTKILKFQTSVSHDDDDDGDDGEHEQSNAGEQQNQRREVCNPYDGVDEVAEKFVEMMMAQASEQAKSFRSVTKERRERQDDDDETTATSVSTRTFTECFDDSDLWPSIGDFTVKAGMEAIEGYMSNWYYEEDWVYNIELTLAQSDECSDFYTYEVKWGIPTKSYPIPQATASVFFTLDVSRVKPPECSVDVTYQFEGCSYKHAPFKHMFKEEWLFRIVEAKLRFFQSLRF